MKLSSKWNRVEDRLPEIGKEVLASFKHGKAQLMFISSINDNKEWYIDKSVFNPPTPSEKIIATHWVPLL